MNATSSIATASIDIQAPRERVWEALVDRQLIKQYMFGTEVTSDWREGSAIRWKGEWKGKPYEDKGTIVKVDPPHRLAYTHFSPMAGQPDKPENYHNVAIELTGDGAWTHVVLTQDNNPTDEARAHSEENWKGMLVALKELMERTPASY